jgi:putative ABC transport system permease protein
VLRDGTRLLGIGLVFGSVAALGAARLLNSQLYQVSSSDPLVMMGTMVAVASVAIVACWMPAWRATRFDPITALRND